MNIHPLLLALQGMCDDPLNVGLIEIGDPQAIATERELEALGQVVYKRLSEFCAGRTAARKALTGMDLPHSDILIGAHRQPLPPAGVVLSISHDRQYALAIAASKQRWFGLGVDLGDADALKPDLIPLICSDGDLRDLVAGESIAERAKLVFCLKEALFKAIFPQVGEWMEFSQSVLKIDHSSGSYEAEIFTADGVSLNLHGQWHGRFAKVGGRWLAVAGLRRLSPLSETLT